VLSAVSGVSVVGLIPFKKRAPGARAPIRGVDLNLDKFDISTPVASTPTGAGWDGWGTEFCSRDFWESVDVSAGSGEESVFEEEDETMLKALFNPCLSDRRSEGDRFQPPEASSEYVARLRALLAEEEARRQARRAHFLGKAFDPENPGASFPASWQPAFGIAAAAGRPAALPATTLYARPDYWAEVSRFERVLQSVLPIFDRSTEDGTRFRIYQVGDLQVRTLQEHSGKELIGAFFSGRPPASASSPEEDGPSSEVPESTGPAEEETLVRITQYVERAPTVSAGCRFYTVLETEAGRALVTERRHGEEAAAWLENAKELEARNSLAKVTRSADCQEAGHTLRDLKAWANGGPGKALTGGESYAQGLYDVVVREP
jgi:hypothetical protein